MKKLKLPLMIVLTVALLCMFACLPKLISDISDTQREGISSYNEILSVQLDITQEAGTMSYADKLFLLKDAQAADVKQSQASMTETQVEAAVLAFLNDLEYAGIYEPFVPTYMFMQPKLMYDLSDASRHLVVWSVTMINKEAPSQSLLLDVDDETGTVLCISYSIYRSYTMDEVWERNSKVVDRFTELYFEKLDMTELAVAARIDDYEYNEIDGGVTEAIYTFLNADDQALTVRITVDGAGGIRVSLL